MTTADAQNDLGQRMNQLSAEGAIKSVVAQGGSSFSAELTGFSTDSDHITVWERSTGSPVRVRRDDKQFLLAKPYNPDRRKTVLVKRGSSVFYAFAREVPGSPGTWEADPDCDPILSAFIETPPDPVDLPVQIASVGEVKTPSRKRRRGRRGRRK